MAKVERSKDPNESAKQLLDFITGDNKQKKQLSTVTPVKKKKIKVTPKS